MTIRFGGFSKLWLWKAQSIGMMSPQASLCSYTLKVATNLFPTS